MSDDHDHNHDNECEHENRDRPARWPAGALEHGQSQILLEMRSQNLDLIKIAAQVAGYAGEHGPLKPSEQRQAMNAIWDIYSEFYAVGRSRGVGRRSGRGRGRRRGMM